MRASSHERLLIVATALLVVAGASCLPADTRPTPGSVLLTTTSGDALSVPTVDGWSITVDRLLIGMGRAGFDYPCEKYTDDGPRYDRLLDATRHADQKVSISYGLGQCPFGFAVTGPNAETVLGEGVTEADREAMQGEPPRPGRPPSGADVDFAATATRGVETKRLHWKFLQPAAYIACTPSRAEDGGLSPLVLESDENLNLRTSVRGTVLFADNAPATDSLRFDPMAAADTTLGNNDGEVSLEEVGKVTIENARQFGGPYGGSESPSPRTLAEYLHQVLFQRIVEFPDQFVCKLAPRWGPHPE